MRLVLFSCALALLPGAAPGDELEFFAGDDPAATLSLERMTALSPPRDVVLSRHFSRSPVKRYRAVPLAPLLAAVYGKDVLDQYTEVVFEAVDGYQSYSTVAALLSGGGHIAFEDLDVRGGWEPVGREEASPAPYFLVWEDPEQNVENGYPWPWQLRRIRLASFAERYPNVVPLEADRDSPEYKGHLVFKAQCFRCHAIDRQGGKIGPDLAAPRHILEYRREDFVREFIKDPETFRYSKMPSHEHLSDQEIDFLIAYLKSRMRDAPPD